MSSLSAGQSNITAGETSVPLDTVRDLGVPYWRPTEHTDSLTCILERPQLFLSAPITPKRLSVIAAGLITATQFCTVSLCKLS